MSGQGRDGYVEAAIFGAIVERFDLHTHYGYNIRTASVWEISSEPAVEAMLTRLQIRNFRGFNALKIDHLSAINLIVGENNSGKTSLLEAIFLLSAAGNTQLAINDNVIRGLAPHGVTTGDPFWNQLFSIVIWDGRLKLPRVVHHGLNLL